MSNQATIRFVIAFSAIVLCISIVSTLTPTDTISDNVELVNAKPIVIENTLVISELYDDINVTSDTTLSDSTLNLNRGISVQNGATLVLDNMSIRMNDLDYSVCSIEVQTGCTIVIDGCYIYPNPSSTNSFSFNWLAL